MAKLSKGTTFADGNSYNAAALNNLVDNATILPGAITEQTALTPTTGDVFMFYSAGGLALGKCTLQDIIAAFPANGSAGANCLRQLGTGSTQAAPGNDSRFSSSVTGVRLGAGAGNLDAAANANDIDLAGTSLGGGTNINWAASGTFSDNLAGANRTYTFSNAKVGSVRSIHLVNIGTITWPTLVGTVPVAGAGQYHIFTFICTALGISGVVKDL